jgi:dihydropteroate synthase
VRVVPLPGRSEDAVRSALLSHGWEDELARTTADGLESLAFHLTQLEPATLEALVHSGSRLGLDLITGDDWALLAGPRARLSSLARPWTSPAALVELATALGHALPADDPVLWQTACGPISLDDPVIVGILNLTPDSFSNGGRYTRVDAAVSQAERLVADGATIVDIGGESTRPGADPIPESLELDRVVPVLDAVRERLPDTPLSIDTVKSSVARAALDRGVAIVNDVSAFRLDPAMAPLVAERAAGVILMHSRGTAGNLASLDHADFPHGVVAGVIEELAFAIGRARIAGVQSERIVVDPGLGFGKTPDQNVELLRGVGALRVFGRPILVGPSRKRFLGELTSRQVEERDTATAAACALGWEAGARLFRVHEPRPVRDALAVAEATRPR